MGVHWALKAANSFPGKVGILDLRTLYPLDEELIFTKAKQYHKILILTEEPVHNTFAQSIAARIQENCFEYLDAPVLTLGAENMPAIPLNEILERRMLPDADKVAHVLQKLLAY